MGYTLLNSSATVLVYGPTLTEDALSCSIISTPSGSILQRVIPKPDFDADRGQALLSSLSNAVENILSEGTAIGATGTQGIDANGLLYDAVEFVVAYTPQGGTPGQITATVDIPVNVLTADTQFGSFLEGGSAADRIDATYSQLRAMATG